MSPSRTMWRACAPQSYTLYLQSNRLRPQTSLGEPLLHTCCKDGEANSLQPAPLVPRLAHITATNVCVVQCQRSLHHKPPHSQISHKPPCEVALWEKEPKHHL
jgi:hypothetical protein